MAIVTLNGKEVIRKRGVIGFATNNHSQISKIIRWFTKSKWSHTFVITDVFMDRVYLMEANAGGTDFRTWREYSNPAVVPTELWQPMANAPAVDAALAKAQERFEGVTYGYFELLGIAMKILAAKMGLRFHDPIEQGAICSQVVWFYLQELFPKEFGDLDEHSVSPEDLHRIVSTSINFRRITP